MQPNAKPSLHLCIINLVIGTLYCAKANFEFGMSRVIKALEPYHRNLEPDTWHYAKRCLLALVEGMAKHVLLSTSSTQLEIVAFLRDVERFGSKVPVNAEMPDGATIATEARLLRRMYLLAYEQQ